MPRKKPAPKPEKPPEPASQGLQLIKRTDQLARGTVDRRVVRLMNLFIREYERQGGNISATCHAVGISRRAYYRWINGTRPVHRQFQKKIARVNPRELLVDVAESVLMHHLTVEKDLTAAIFTAKTQGRHRGWSERPEVIAENNEVLERVAKAFGQFRDDHPDLKPQELWMWLTRFAQGGKYPVPVMDLAKKVGIDPGQIQGANQ
jgi:transposase-like protein